MANDDDVTMAELGRRVKGVEDDLKGMGRDLTEIKTALATQGVKVGVVWTAVGLGASALVSSAISTAVMVLQK